MDETEEIYNPHDDISAAYYSLISIEDIDTELMDEENSDRVNEIKDMSIKIIHKALKYIYDSTYAEAT